MSAEHGSPEQFLKVRPSVKGVGRATGFIRDFCAKNGIAGAVASKLAQAGDEILPNIVPLCSSPRILLGLELHSGNLEFSIRHSGPRYDLSDRHNLVWPAEMEQSKISELGLDIIHRSVDLVSSKYIDGENLTTLVKRVE